MNEVATTQSVLEMMTADVMARKAQAKAKLTPVGREAGAVAPSPITVLPRVPGAPFPNDDPQQTILTAVAQIERELAIITEAIVAVRGMLAGNAEAAPDPLTARKVKEAAADAVQKERAEAEEQFVAALKAEEAADNAPVEPVPPQSFADAAVFGPDPRLGQGFADDFAAKAAAAQASVFGTPAVEDPTGKGWLCPVHGKAIAKTSRLGRIYRACPEGDDFEKLA